MSSEANRLRSSGLFKIIHQDYNLIFSIVKIKVAFGYDDDNEKADNQEVLDENNSTLSNQTSDKNNGDTDIERFYQKSFILQFIIQLLKLY